MLDGGLCSIEKATCIQLANVHPQHWDYQCEECPIGKRRRETVSIDRDVEFVLYVEALRMGGYPFERDDLTVEQWITLGIISGVREEAKWRTSEKSKSSSPPQTPQQPDLHL